MADKPYDPTLKALVEISPGDWPALFNLPPGPTTVIDADIATISGATDKAIRVDADPPYLLHLEFHSGHDAAVQPELYHLRSTLLNYRHQLRVRTAAVLLKPDADSPALSGEWSVAFPGEDPYDRLLRIWQEPPEVFLHGGPAMLPLAPISAVTEAELPGIIREMERRLASRRLRPVVPELWTATNILMGLRWPEELAEHLLPGVRSMKESVTYQAILREGEAKGEVKGALAEAKRLLRLLGEGRFGPPDAALAAKLEALNDLLRLEEMMLHLPKCGSWQELLARPASRQRNGKRRPKA